MIGVKVCGITDAAGFDATVAAGADWIGFNFFPPSPRYLTAAAAAALSARHAGGPARVGLFVDPADAAVADALAAVALDALQVYAAPDRVAALRARFGVPVWLAVGVATPADLPGEPLAVDALLVEPRPAPNATRPGGNATALDWRITRKWAAPLPWLLAGGLTPENVAEAIALSGAPAVDVASGVERSRGVKDPELIRRFVAAAKAVRPAPRTGSMPGTIPAPRRPARAG